ncbi:MAG: hypothetical protein HY905_22745 [Deltaproteobacteria bacterium]|nr:hypothetical protein [Deltaproteobacteria bacterium]
MRARTALLLMSAITPFFSACAKRGPDAGSSAEAGSVPATGAGDATLSARDSDAELPGAEANQRQASDDAVTADGGTATDTGTPAIAPDGAETATAGHDFIAEARMLFRLVACGGDEPLPEGVRPEWAERHCRALERTLGEFELQWLSKARPFFAALVPPDLPKRVVYPFAGADLLSALAVFPDAEEITTLSLEPAGDVRAVRELRPHELEQQTDEIRDAIGRLIRVNHSLTFEMAEIMTWGGLPAHLAFTLVALKNYGFEPVSLRYFTLDPDGSVRYLDDEMLAAIPAELVWSERNKHFANVELRYRKARDPDAPVRVFRHLGADLGDETLALDDRVLRHLATKGDVAAMTKAASYLLWRDEFGRIRQYLLEHAVWTVSDSTGIPPRYTRPAGLEQETWGDFAGPFMAAGPADDFLDLFSNNPRQTITFRFGYPDSQGRHHLVVTRRPAAAGSPADAGGNSAPDADAGANEDAGSDAPPAVGAAMPGAGLTPLTAEQKAIVDSVAGDEAGRDPIDQRHYVQTNEPRHDDWFPYIDGVGGAYVGVGSDQNYTLFARARSELIWLMDYDIVVTRIHRVFGALIAAAPDAAAFLAFFERDGTTAALEVLDASRDDEDDREELRELYKEYKPSLRHYFQRLATLEADGKPSTWLSDPEAYAWVRAAFVAGRVRTLKGDLLGRTVLPAIASAQHRLDMPVRVVYLSNAEQYFLYNAAFKDAFAALPFDGRSVILRTENFEDDQGRNSMIWHYQVEPARHFVAQLARPEVDHTNDLEPPATYRPRGGLSLLGFEAPAPNPVR